MHTATLSHIRHHSRSATTQGQTGHLIFVHSGSARVATDQRAEYLVPEQRALWLPASGERLKAVHGAQGACILPLRATSCDSLPDAPRVFEISALLCEVILEISRMSHDERTSVRGDKLQALLCDELLHSALTAPVVPMPADPRLARLCTSILRDPARHWALDACAAEAAMSRRTFTRRFRAQMGCSFVEWCKRARCARAVSLLAGGKKVSAVALELGYTSYSAFSAMFRRVHGCSPRRFLRRKHKRSAR